MNPSDHHDEGFAFDDDNASDGATVRGAIAVICLIVLCLVFGVVILASPLSAMVGWK